MPVTLVVNGVGYNYPVSGDENWAENATNWAVAVTQNLTSLNQGLSNFNAGIFSLGNGSVGAPSLRFTNSPTTGLYRVGIATLGFAANGVAAGQVDATSAWTFGPASEGVTHSFLGSVNISQALTVIGALNVTSIVASGNISGVNGTFSGVLSGGSFSTSSVTAGTGSFSTSVASALFLAADGSAANPSYAFQNSTSTGLFLRGSNSLGLSANGNELLYLDAGLTKFLHGLTYSAASVGASTYNCTSVDTLLNVNFAGSVAVTLPTADAGRFIVVKDVSGLASANNITILPASGTIDGASSVVLNTNYGSAVLFADGTNWSLAGGSGNVSGAVRTVTGSTTLSASDNVILVNQSGAVTITLPSPVSGKVIEVKDVNGASSSFNISIVRDGSALIDGQTTIVITQNYQSLRFIADGTNWSVM